MRILLILFIFLFNYTIYNQTAKEYYPFIDFRTQDLTNMNYKDNEFDISLFSHGTSNMLKYNKVFEETCRVTKKYIILHRFCV